jgi:effector-binding domain-containing protein
MAASVTSSCTIVTVERQPTAIIRAEATFAELPQVQRTARAKLAAVASALDAGPAGAACTRWTPPVGGKLPMEIGMIVARPFTARDGVLPSELPAGRAVLLSMKGGFENLPIAWQTLFDWCKAENHAPAGINWEIYGEMQDAELYALLAYD